MEVVVHLCVLLVTREVGDFDYGVSKSKTKPSFKIAEALSSTSHDQGGSHDSLRQPCPEGFMWCHVKERATQRLCTQGKQAKTARGFSLTLSHGNMITEALNDQ